MRVAAPVREGGWLTDLSTDAREAVLFSAGGPGGAHHRVVRLDGRRLDRSPHV